MKANNARELADQQILETLRSWNLNAKLDGQGIACGIGGMRARCLDVEISMQGNMASLIVELLVDPGRGLLMQENVAHFGSGTVQAIGGAAFMWGFSVFIPAAALHDPDGCPGQMAGRAERTFVDNEGTERLWKIYSSPALEINHGDEAGDEKPADYHPATLPLLEPLLPPLAKEPRPHWLKVFMMHSGSEFSGDCSVDSQSSPEGLELLRGHQWAQPEGTHSLRQFHILAPADYQMAAPPAEQPARGGLLGKMFGRG